MTCQDCIHFKKDKEHYAEWDDYICEYSAYGPYYYTADCPVNEFCDNKFKRKSACDDCIYTYPDCPTGEIDKKFDEVHGDNFKVVSCVNYVNNDGSYHDGHWHCHRCGKIVEVGGLCVDCDRMLDSWESVSK